jgi:hypothetical protein
MVLETEVVSQNLAVWKPSRGSQLEEILLNFHDDIFKIYINKETSVMNYDGMNLFRRLGVDMRVILERVLQKYFDFWDVLRRFMICSTHVNLLEILFLWK